MLALKSPEHHGEGTLRAGFAGLFSSLVALILYIATDHPQASHGDVAEFQTLAATGGIAHAGYPALVMALRAFGFLRYSTYAYRANLLSSFSAAIGVGLAGYAGSRLAKSALAGTGAALALAISLTLWQDGTQAEVYAFTLAIAVGLFLFAVDFAERPSPRTAFAIGVLGGLGVVSHLSVLGLIPVVAASAYFAARAHALRPRHLIMAASGFALGLLPLAYLFFQDRPAQPMNYIAYTVDLGSGEYFPIGTPPLSRLAGISWLLSGHQYFAKGLFQPFQDLGRRTTYLFLDLSLNEFPLVGFPLATLGTVTLWRQKSRTGFMLGLWLLSLLFWFSYAAYPNVIRDFFVPGLWILSLFIAAGVGVITHWKRWAGIPAVAVLLLMPMLRLQLSDPPLGSARGDSVLGEVWAEWPWDWSPTVANLSWDRWGRAVMSILPPQAIVLSTWEEGMTLRYLQYAEAARPDVSLEMTGLYPRRVERAIQSGMKLGRPIYFSFDPTLAGLDSTSTVRASAFNGPLWTLRGETGR